jgi:hypothetical protein
MTDVIGTIKMKSPGGKDSSISVSTKGNDVDIHFMRSSQGELLVMLKKSQARELGGLLLEAAKTL